MKFDFLLVTSWSDQDVAIKRETARELERQGNTTAILSPTEKARQKAGDAATRTFSLDSLAGDRTLKPAEIEDRFDISSTRFLCHTEQTYFQIDYDTALTRAQSIAAAVEQLLLDHSFTYAFQARGGELFRLLVHFGMEQYGGTNIWTAFSPFEESIVFSTGLDNLWDTYRTISYSDMSDNERDSVRQHMKQFRSDQKRYLHDTPESDSDPGLVLRNVRSLVSTTKQVVFPDYPRQLPTRVRIRATRAVSGYFNRQFTPSLGESKRLCETSRYVFFPLQYPEESRLTVFSPEFFDQEWIVEYLSRSVPDNTYIFVKQHPNHIGQQSPLWLRRLFRLPNVKFLCPELSAHKIISDADATIVTNNTVGFETLFYSTPLMVLGQAFYRDTPAVRTVDRLSNLRSVVATAIEENVSEKDRIASIHSLREAVFNVERGGSIERHASGAASGILAFIDRFSV